MLPGPGAGQGQSDDRERQTTVWMPEDHATWTSDDEVAPPVIGDLDPKELGRTPPRPEEEANAHPTAESDLGNVEDASPVEESELLNALVNVDDVLDEVQQDLDSASRGDQRKGGSAGG